MKRTPIEVFLPAYLKAAEEGMTKEEFAKQIGVAPATVYQRIYEIRRKRPEVPLLKSAGKIPLMDRVDAILKGSSVAKVEAESPKPKPKAKPKAKPVVAEEAAEQAEVSADEEATLDSIFG